MSTLSLTLILALILVGLSMILLGLGYLITGKSKIERGLCGRDPNQKKGSDESCQKQKGCSLCDHESDLHTQQKPSRDD